jgi:acyl carrier protein
MYLLDAHGQPVPLGAIGELYIGGDGVARGYFNRPELTAERFLHDPFDGRPDARMYRTGDLARYLPDGNLTFLGRNDHQVKLRGFRIELGEIEATLARHASVRQAVVIVGSLAGDRQLVAYVIPVPGTTIAGAELRRHLAENLPEYMVPAAFVSMTGWPLTASGKIDRARLPDPVQEPTRSRRPPETAIEEVVAAIWAEQLGCAPIDRDASFFDLGGHSLLATRVLARIGEVFRVSLPILALFDAPTVEAFAREVAATVTVPGQADQIASAWVALRAMSPEEQTRLRFGSKGEMT